MEFIGRKEELRRTLEPQENLVVFLDELPDAVEKLDEIASWASGQTPPPSNLIRKHNVATGKVPKCPV